MTAYYNENDPFAAQWLRNLIAAGHIAPGEVDERSIEDVRPSDLSGFTQCHFFAGIGGWSYALRLAGWDDARPVWTGSCPCQPFSAAGKGAGFADERHLWPSWLHLISQCHPAVIFGEQVASKDAGPWIDLVQDDMEGVGYAFGAVPFPAASVGAPHIRDRLYWVANSSSTGLERCDAGEVGRQRETTQRGGCVSGMAYDNNDGLARPGSIVGVEHTTSYEWGQSGLPAANRVEAAGAETAVVNGNGISPFHADPTNGFWRDAERASVHAGGLADANGSGRRGREGQLGGLRPKERLQASQDGPARPTNGFWRDADWLACRDAKWRPVEPGTFPLAHGIPARVGRLRGYGNAIVPQAAQAFIESYSGVRA